MCFYGIYKLSLRFLVSYSMVFVLCFRRAQIYLFIYFIKVVWIAIYLVKLADRRYKHDLILSGVWQPWYGNYHNGNLSAISGINFLISSSWNILSAVFLLIVKLRHVEWLFKEITNLQVGRFSKFFLPHRKPIFSTQAFLSWGQCFPKQQGELSLVFTPPLSRSNIFFLSFKFIKSCYKVH